MLKISLAPSTTLLYGIGAVHAVAAFLLLATDIPGSVKTAGMLVLGASLAFYLWRIVLLRSPQSIVAIEIGDGDKQKIAFQTRNGRWHACRLLGTSFVSPGLTILNLNPEDARLMRSVVIVPDNVQSEDFRQLRIWLRWKAQRP